MKIPSKVMTYIHSLIGIGLAMVVIYFTLNFIRTRGPTVLQGPAGTAGQAISGAKFNF